MPLLAWYWRISLRCKNTIIESTVLVILSLDCKKSFHIIVCRSLGLCSEIILNRFFPSSAFSFTLDILCIWSQNRVTVSEAKVLNGDEIPFFYYGFLRFKWSCSNSFDNKGNKKYISVRWNFILWLNWLCYHIYFCNFLMKWYIFALKRSNFKYPIVIMTRTVLNNSHNFSTLEFRNFV